MFGCFDSFSQKKTIWGTTEYFSKQFDKMVGGIVHCGGKFFQRNRLGQIVVHEFQHRFEGDYGGYFAAKLCRADALYKGEEQFGKFSNCGESYRLRDSQRRLRRRKKAQG